ncbi:GYDIA family GHMP kinase [Plebeiibacterium marinum]|uniref:GYDIA family GHMP kinase n=1 Tax=Plebeiibacterium marinum TaxID=2992111 RepID=A0AAE3MGY2_9BACT|nr:GYDIA family GHMP kinase [Plebeiobacterium marinum]MCW3806837.1 GYDIA family GHMP kinase [Plebeiobacterium marinum]
MSNTPQFSCRSNGKLLLSGEYFVLSGAKALALPLRLGQTLNVFPTSNNKIIWNAYQPAGAWQRVQFNDTFSIIECTNEAFAKRLRKILIAALNLCKKNINELLNKEFVTHLEFNPDWGFGSSSTLINNLAIYFKIDGYKLLSQTFTGSGYDIACAQYSSPLFFRLQNNKAHITKTDFNPPFKNHIYFVYLGSKKNSQQDVIKYKNQVINPRDASRISSISTLMAVCNKLSEYQDLIKEHEEIVSKMLDKIPVQQKHFSDFNGSVKSLGAWGGDYIMAVSDKSSEYVNKYFNNKKLKTIFSFNDLIIR